ncbi:hypothetical protein IWZ03DRAFT_359433 [Phyllosticta citriasiana]|uniref:Uncharacterized protein n=1 Tax=Phyllosticta citriasiana TaxID=595635 RepID=A0ABR1KNM7_9PEZI
MDYSTFSVCGWRVSSSRRVVGGVTKTPYQIGSLRPTSNVGSFENEELKLATLPGLLLPPRTPQYPRLENRSATLGQVLEQSHLRPRSLLTRRETDALKAQSEGLAELKDKWGMEAFATAIEAELGRQMSAFAVGGPLSEQDSVLSTLLRRRRSISTTVGCAYTEREELHINNGLAVLFAFRLELLLGIPDLLPAEDDKAKSVVSVHVGW